MLSVDSALLQGSPLRARLAPLEPAVGDVPPGKTEAVSTCGCGLGAGAELDTAVP